MIARPLSGFAETFSQYIVEVAPGGGSDQPEPDPAAEAVLFVVEGGADAHRRRRGARAGPGGYAFLPPGADWTLRNTGDAAARFHWIRKAYQRVEGIDVPPAVRHQRGRRGAGEMPGTEGRWTTQRFVDPPTCATTCTSTSSTSSRAA